MKDNDEIDYRNTKEYKELEESMRISRELVSNRFDQINAENDRDTRNARIILSVFAVALITVVVLALVWLFSA